MQVRGYGLRLGDLFGFQALALEHILKIHIAAHIELHGALQAHAAVFKELRHDAVSNGGAHLGLNIIAHDGQPGVFELLRPYRIRSNKDRQGIDKGAAGIDGRLGVELIRFFRAHRQVGDYDVGAGLAEYGGDVGKRGFRFRDGFLVVPAEAVQGRTALHGNAQLRDVGNGNGAVAGAARSLR